LSRKDPEEVEEEEDSDEDSDEEESVAAALLEEGIVLIESLVLLLSLAIIQSAESKYFLSLGVADLFFGFNAPPYFPEEVEDDVESIWDISTVIIDFVSDEDEGEAGASDCGTACDFSWTFWCSCFDPKIFGFGIAFSPFIIQSAESKNFLSCFWVTFLVVRPMNLDTTDLQGSEGLVVVLLSPFIWGEIRVLLYFGKGEGSWMTR